jgi:protein SCO1/2
VRCKWPKNVAYICSPHREGTREQDIWTTQPRGPFSLISSVDGKPFTDKGMLGKWSLVYFGFTNCPDICSAELDKVGGVMDTIGAFFLGQCFSANYSEMHSSKHGPVFQPLFISVDPDTPSQVKQYLLELHPSCKIHLRCISPRRPTQALNGAT